MRRRIFLLSSSFANDKDERKLSHPFLSSENSFIFVTKEEFPGITQKGKAFFFLFLSLRILLAMRKRKPIFSSSERSERCESAHFLLLWQKQRKSSFAFVKDGRKQLTLFLTCLQREKRANICLQLSLQKKEILEDWYST